MSELYKIADDRLGGTPFGQEALRKLRIFKLTWISKTDDYIDFISSPLIGVYRVRFSSRDENMFFRDFLGVDEDEIQNDINSCSEIPKNFKVATSAFNFICIYLVVRFINSDLPKDKIKEAIVEIYNILALKMLGSIFSNFFPYDVDITIAQTVYQNLSDKYLIKKEGSWEKVLNKMSSLLFPDGVHGSRLKKNFPGDDYIRVINDVNTRLRSLVKNYASAIYTLINNKDENRIKTTTLVQNGEEGEIIKDIISGANRQVEYLRMILPSPTDFVDDVKIRLISTVMGNIKPDKLKLVLYHLSKTGITPGDVDYCSIAIKQSRSYLQARGQDHDVNKRILEVLKTLKRYYSASKVKILDIRQMKETLERQVRVAMQDQKNWLASPLVIASILYLYLISLK